MYYLRRSIVRNERRSIFYDDQKLRRQKGTFMNFEHKRNSNFGENKEQLKITDLHEYMMMAQQPYEDWNN